MRLVLTSVNVDDQDKALRCYTDVLGFVTKNEIPLGEHRWLTDVSPEDPDGVELVLEPSDPPAVGARSRRHWWPTGSRPRRSAWPTSTPSSNGW